MGLKTFHTSHGLLIAAAVTRQKPIRAPHHAQKMNSKFRDYCSFRKLQWIFFRRVTAADILKPIDGITIQCWKDVRVGKWHGEIEGK